MTPAARIEAQYQEEPIFEKISRVRFVVSDDPFSTSRTLAITGTLGSEEDNFLRVWSVEQKAPGLAGVTKRPFAVDDCGSAKHDGEVRDLLVLSEDRVLTASSRGAIALFRLHESERNVRVYAGNDELEQRTDRCYKIKRLLSRRVHSIPNAHIVAATGIAVEPYNDMDPDVASVGEDGRLAFLRLEDLSERFTIAQAGGTGINAVTWATSNEVLVATSGGQLRKFDRRDPRRAAARYVSRARAKAGLTCVVCNPSQRTQLATGSSNGMVTIWDARCLPDHESRPLKEEKMHSLTVWEVMFHPNHAGVVLSCSGDGSISMMSFNGTDVGNLTPGPGRHRIRAVRQDFKCTTSVNTIHYHPHAKILVAGTDGTSLLLSNMD